MSIILLASATRADRALAAIIFMIVGSFPLVFSVRSIRRGSITCGSRKKMSTFYRSNDPFNFWGFVVWFLLFGSFIVIAGFVSLIAAIAT